MVKIAKAHRRAGGYGREPSPCHVGRKIEFFMQKIQLVAQEQTENTHANGLDNVWKTKEIE